MESSKILLYNGPTELPPYLMSGLLQIKPSTHTQKQKQNKPSNKKGEKKKEGRNF